MAVVTGAPDGVGVFRKPPLWLKPGDRGTIESEQIGALANPVEQKSAR
jgi:2-keto-4-pentenoate hydratase/2-oxohepta-3-ene-1,7-dioic acid hydratase in catechol pathway